MWDITKEVLGWKFDGQEGTIRLPLLKCKNICTLLCKILKKKRITLNEFQKIAGKLQHAAFGLPGGQGLFNPIDMAIKDELDFITMTTSLRQCVEDWRCIVQSLNKSPNSVLQLVFLPPTYISYTDACKLVSGGS